MSENRKILVVGSLCWFVDSFRTFKEIGFDCYYLKLPTEAAFKRNYSILSDAGFQKLEVIDGENQKNAIIDLLKNLKFGERDIIFSGGYFYGKVNPYNDHLRSDLIQLKVLCWINEFYREKLGPVIVRYFNGDTFLNTSKEVDILESSIANSNVLFFDSENLKNYVLSRCPKFKRYRIHVVRVELPLERFVVSPVVQSKIVKDDIPVLNIGRNFLNTKTLIFHQYPAVPKGIYEKILLFTGLKKNLNIASADSLLKLDKNRNLFSSVASKYIFGLGHFYDFFERRNLPSIGDDFTNDLFSHVGISTPNYHMPLIYSYTNVASKVITYLMYNLIPLVPVDRNDFYQQLKGENMVIKIESSDNFTNDFLNSISPDLILEMKKTIYENRHLFTLKNLEYYY